MINWITDYCDYVKNNPKKFCNKIKRLTALVIKLLNRKDIEYKPSDPIAFQKFSKMFKHKEGIWAGQPLILNKEQLFISACVLGIKQYNAKHKMWLRYFRELNLFVARKFGKTLFISALGLFLLGFDKEKGAFGEILAENEIQSKKLYRLICDNSKQTAFRGIFEEKKTEKFLQCTLNNGRLVYLSGRKKGKQGSNPSFFINDEANEITNKGQYSDKKQGMGARLQPLAIVISSAGITPESLYEMLYERNSKILEKKQFSDKERVFPVIFEIDAEDKVEDESCWIKANPCMDRDLPSLNYLQQLYETSKDDPLELMKFSAFNLNRQVGSSVAWYNMVDIKKCMQEVKMENFYDTYATGGVDLASTMDLCNSTAKILLEDGRSIILQAYFIASECLDRNSKKDKQDYNLFTNMKADNEIVSRVVIITQGTQVDFHAVTQWFVTLRDEFKINFLKIGYDKAMANYWISDMVENGFAHEKVTFDRENRVESRDDGILTPCYQGIGLDPAIRISRALFETGKYIVDLRNKLLPYCFYNVRVVSNNDNKLSVSKIKSNGHIDGCIGLYNSEVAYDRAKQIYKDQIPDNFKI